MTDRQKRSLTDRDIQRISELWRSYQALRKLREHALPSTAKGAWIAEAATLQMELIARDLESLFEETYSPELDD